MARHSIIICDVCGNPTDELAGKLSWIPNIPGVSQLNWNNYTHTAHIGMCCKERVFGFVKFDKRMTQTEYRAQRTKNAKRSTVKARKTKAASNGT